MWGAANFVVDAKLKGDFQPFSVVFTVPTCENSARVQNLAEGCRDPLPPSFDFHLILPVQGLSRDQPLDPRTTKSLSQSPNRSHLILEYIFEKTDKHGAPEHVGGWLQQLRDAHQGEQGMSNRLRTFFPGLF